MPVAANEKWWIDSALKSEAEGYQMHLDGFLKIVRDRNANLSERNPAGIFVRNGGLVAMRRVELAEDNMLYRFAAKKYMSEDADTLLPLLNSPWWLEEDRMVLLLARAREANVQLSEMARRQLALPTDWSDCDIIVRVRPKSGVVLAAHAGPGRTTIGMSGEARIIAREAPHLFMDQLYVPGLGLREKLDKKKLDKKGMENVRTWFNTTTARAFDPRVRGLNPA